jgi:hypothetical protein
MRIGDNRSNLNFGQSGKIHRLAFFRKAQASAAAPSNADRTKQHRQSDCVAAMQLAPVLGQADARQ